MDTETTGRTGHPKDRILEIGIVKINLETFTIDLVYDEVVGYTAKELTTEQKKAWIFDNSTLSLQSVLKGKPVLEVANEVKKLLNNKLVAIYHVDYDYGKFLKYEPFHINCTILPCIMKNSTIPCKIPNPYPYSKYKWPKLIEAQKILLDEDDIPEFIDPHRAISDAYISAMILIKLVSEHNYSLSGYV